MNKQKYSTGTKRINFQSISGSFFLISEKRGERGDWVLIPGAKRIERGGYVFGREIFFIIYYSSSIDMLEKEGKKG